MTLAHVVARASGVQHDVPSQTCPVGQLAGQLMAWPQLLVATTLHLPVHVVDAGWGVQHDVPSQTWPLGQPAGQLMACPQLLVTCVAHLPLHGVTLSGTQHPPSLSQTSPAVGQLAEPPAPHGTCWPQLLVTVPHTRPAHAAATLSGTQPHAPASLQVRPPSQPPQFTDALQLSVVAPQRPEHQPLISTHRQACEVGSHVWLAPQAAHWRVTPQLSDAAPQWVSQK
jgi:hypothetical protein